MTITELTLRHLANWHDQVGVVSLYTTRVRGRWSRAAVADQVHDGLLAVAGTGSVLTRVRRRAADARLRSVQFDLSDPRRAGTGCAVFLSLGGGQTYTVSLPSPVSDLVSCGPVAYLGPLIADVAAAPPFGVAAVCRDGLRLIDHRCGHATDETAFVHEDTNSHRRRLQGPAPAHPRVNRHGVSHHDLHTRRGDVRLARFLATAGRRVAATAAAYGWRYLAVTGEPALVDATVAGMPRTTAVRVVRAGHRVAWLPADVVAAAVAGDIDRTRRRDHHHLTALVCDRAAAATATRGLPATLAALRAGTVEQLLVDPDHPRLRGFAASGQRSAGDRGRSTTAAEPDALGSLLDTAFRQHTRFTLLDPATTGPLRDADGIAAFVRG